MQVLKIEISDQLKIIYKNVSKLIKHKLMKFLDNYPGIKIYKTFDFNYSKA